MKLYTGQDIHHIHNSSTDIMSTWKGAAGKAGFDFPEIITPVLFRNFPIKEFPVIAARPLSKLAGDRLKKFEPWTYHIPFDGGSTKDFGTFNDSTTLFHRYRAELICGTTKLLLGEEYENSSILDIACNCGIFAIEAKYQGANIVDGFDLRPENIKQAESLAQEYEQEVYFDVEDVKDTTSMNVHYDVIFNLGLMYHLSDPLSVLDRCYRKTNKFCVIDSICHKEPFSGFHLVTGKNPDSVIEGDLHYELQPTYRGLVDAIKAVGFKDVIEVVGSEVGQVDLYNSHVRRCLIAFKDSSASYLEGKLSN